MILGCSPAQDDGQEPVSLGEPQLDRLDSKEDSQAVRRSGTVTWIMHGVCVCLCVYINAQPATCHPKSETLAGFAGPVDPANLDTQPVDIMTLFPLLEQKQHQFATDAPEQEARRQAAKASVCAG